MRPCVRACACVCLINSSFVSDFRPWERNKYQHCNTTDLWLSLQESADFLLEEVVGLQQAFLELQVNEGSV